MKLRTKRHFSPSLNAANILLAVVCAAVLAACGGSDTEDAADPGASEAPAAADVSTQAEDTGPHLSGKITFYGPRPVRVELSTAADPLCTAMHKDEPLLSDHAIVSERGELKDVFVYVKEPPEGNYPVPAEQLVLDQIGCSYVPHVFGIQIGQELSVQNSDPLLHNIRSFARKNRPFNNAQEEGAAPRVKKFGKVELGIRMKCDIHPWMTGFIFALDHPYFGTSAENGVYGIHGLPAGDYTLVAWHEEYGEQEAAVTVAEDGSGVADFVFSPAE